MKASFIVLAALALSWLPVRADLILAAGGKPNCVVVQQSGATEPEKYAVKELVRHLNEITGGSFAVEAAGGKPPSRAIIVGPGPAAKAAFPKIPFDKLGGEEIVIQTSGNRLLLAGGRPRGTLYAVSRFLQDQCGVRWWTPWASHIPVQKDLRVKALDVRYQPVFESRDPFWFPAFNREWAIRNCSNSQNAGIPSEQGGCIRYKGFVHTFHGLVPPAQHFAAHPEWFSLIKGKRSSDHAQLCLSNPELRDFVVGRVKEWLRESPEAAIVSVSQNDWHGACECESCKAIDDAEGGPTGSLLAFVNYVAEKIEPEFPHVAVDTLAYQYTRKPPRTLKPRPNVIIRLCSIECNFREPLDHPSNATFAQDIIGWAGICNRLYIWDYTTDFGHYVQPHPNWFVLGPNVRFFRDHHVKGLFEQGAYQSFGSEMTELRSWVLAQLSWNPDRDDRALINEFLDGYYGAAAANPIGRYLGLMHEASKGWNLTCFSKTDTPFHQFKYLSQAEALWREAEAAVAGQPDLALRVRVSKLPLGYVWLSRWEKLRTECQAAGATWPLPASRKAYAESWVTLAKGVPEAPWTQVKMLNEGGLTPDAFLGRFEKDPPEPKP
jgi:hypothetical protein